MDALKEQGAEGEVMRVADLDIKPGVTSDEGDGDQWPAARARVVACDILVIGSPIWLGQPSSIAKRSRRSPAATMCSCAPSRPS
jgi:multimeric flavodoxin WrbA